MLRGVKIARWTGVVALTAIAALMTACIASPEADYVRKGDIACSAIEDYADWARAYNEGRAGNSAVPAIGYARTAFRWLNLWRAMDPPAGIPADLAARMDALKADRPFTDAPECRATLKAVAGALGISGQLTWAFTSTRVGATTTVGGSGSASPTAGHLGIPGASGPYPRDESSQPPGPGPS